MKNNKKNNDSMLVKWPSVLGLCISVLLLIFAIILSQNEEQVEQVAVANKIYKGTSDWNIVSTSTSVNKNINVIKGDKSNYVIDENTLSEENTAKNYTEEIKDENVVAETNVEVANEQNVSNVEQANKEEKNSAQFIMPVEGEVIKNYSMDSLVYSNTLQEWGTHRGIDIKAEKTTVVKAIADGTIKAIKEDPRYGLSITIEHKNGFKSVYSSLLSSEFVKEGEEVTQGQSIGTIGNTAVFEVADGPHLHLELLKDNSYVNPEMYI